MTATEGGQSFRHPGHCATLETGIVTPTDRSQDSRSREGKGRNGSSHHLVRVLKPGQFWWLCRPEHKASGPEQAQRHLKGECATLLSSLGGGGRGKGTLCIFISNSSQVDKVTVCEREAGKTLGALPLPTPPLLAQDPSSAHLQLGSPTAGVGARWSPGLRAIK